MAWIDGNLGRQRNPGYNYNPDQVRVRVDRRDQLHDENPVLRNQVHQLRQVAQNINIEGRDRNELLNQLEGTVSQGRAELETATRRLNRAPAQRGTNPLDLTIGFALLCFFFVYLYTKWFRPH